MAHFLIRYEPTKGTSVGGTDPNEDVETLRKAYIETLFREKRVIVSETSAPTEQNLIIIEADSLPSAVQIAEGDPAVERGLLEFKINEFVVEVNSL